MLKIMLAEDSRSSRAMMKGILESAAFQVHDYESGTEVLENFSRVRPDAIILDVGMPGMSGIEVCAELRRRAESFNIPLALVSAADSEEDIIRGFTAGADEYMLKPIKRNEFLSKIKILVNKRLKHIASGMAENVIFAGHYLIKKSLGQGGFSEVYLAEDSRTGKKTALKILESGRVEKKYISQFLREAYGLSLLSHPNIVKLIEFGNFADNYYLVTEFAGGESLRSIIERGPVSEERAVALASEMLSAMEHMSKFGIIHRDIKPDNIIITPEGKSVLVDFGLARGGDQNTLSGSGEMQGTPHFLAPEYIKGAKHLSIKVDIYSLGVTLYYAVTGEPPFRGNSAGVLFEQLNTKPPKLENIMPGKISPAFSTMVARMLVKDPRGRASLRELSAALRACSRPDTAKGDITMDKNSAAQKAADKAAHDKLALEYHRHPAPGKIAVVPTKPCGSQKDLSLAYTPGVAAPCVEIQKNPEKIWDYTSRKNLVAVVSDGTAVLGLGNIGPGAGLPVMEGKSVLFKYFADIDAVPVCLGRVFNPDGTTNPKLLIETVQRLEPTFGGFNLEDIGAPACFEVEQTLKKTVAVPVFHDDQHGTAIISLAALLSAVKLTGKKLEDCRIVVNGAGAAGIACSEFYILGGAKRENFILCDSKGVIHRGRKDGMTPEKERFAAKTDARTLEDAMRGADIFVGLSKGNVVSPEMVKSMAKDPIVFAMANPTPEIFPEDAIAAGAAVAGSGRSDFANQVNNVLGFPGIFRGALDVRASTINEEMKLAASRALAEIASEKTPDNVYEVLADAYPSDARSGMFDGACPLKSVYVIPKPFDPRVVPRVARYVAEAAAKSGAAALPVKDPAGYEAAVAERLREARG